jgi:hypothetical protein
MTTMTCSSLAAALLLGSMALLPAKDSYYKEPPLFSTAPSPEKSVNTIARFGPVGMGIDLIQPAFTMQIRNIEEGSPAAAGGLEAGQIITSINGQTLAGIDPRIQLGQILAKAEATDGVLKFLVADKPGGSSREVIVKVPVLGAYSATWPLDCPKSGKIVRGFADYLARPDSHQGFSGFGMLFLLATGEDQDLEIVKVWARAATKRTPTYAWHLGFGGIPLCEYYLRTGDEEVMPAIQNWVDSAVAGQVLDGWAGRGGIAGVTYGGGGGHLNAGGTAVVTFLLLAKECGADVPDDAMLGALEHFVRYAGRGINPYGDGRPETSFVDNGKQGNLAFAMAAAASLTPEGEDSVYAAARDHCAMTSFYTTTFMLHGHTGGGIGEIWRSAAMGLLHETKPRHYREFMDHRQWHYDLSRRWDGSFGILGGARYDNTEWGNCYPMAYVIPRKTLRLTGAPPSKFSRKYQLPRTPWGTKADNVFVSLEPAALPDGTRPDFSKETLTKDSAKPLISGWLAMNQIPDDVVRNYAHHPSFLVRRRAALYTMGFLPRYMGAPRGAPVRLDLAHELFRSKDPRVRSSAITAMTMGFPSEDPDKCLTPGVFDGLIAMLEDPDESWWVKDRALQLIGKASPDRIVPHVDVIVPFLKHEEWWLRNAALTALAPVVADERCYERILPAIGELVRTNQRWNVTSPLRWGLMADNLGKAGPKVRKLAAATLKESFTGYAGVTSTPAGLDITKNHNSHLEFIAGTLAKVPGGYDVLYEVAKERFPNDPLPFDTIFLGADPERFGPDLKQAIEPIIREKLVYEFIGKNRRSLEPEMANTRQSSFVHGKLDELVALYNKVGVNDYNWHKFGPDLEEAIWNYHTFDPPEKMKFDLTPWRYREVTCPAGMENWHLPDFDPGRAGWKKGQTPIGQYKGRLVTDSTPCSNASCRHSHPMRSLWEKECLLIRGTFEFPPLKPGAKYRIRIGTGQHVGSGDGYRIHINGRELIETKNGVGRRQGAKPRGAYITADFVGEFSKGPVTIAATTFLRYGSKAIATSPPVPQGIFSLWVEEMKLPPVNEEAIRKSATLIPMLSSEWQAGQDPENAGQQGEDTRFHYDGKFVANPEIPGHWTVHSLVSSLEDFDPDKKKDGNRARIKDITFMDKGLTSSGTMIWSDDMLMDLDRYEALKMRLESIGGTEYLVIEAGGFSTRNKPDWQSPLIVMTRK